MAKESQRYLRLRAGRDLQPPELEAAGLLTANMYLYQKAAIGIIECVGSNTRTLPSTYYGKSL